MLANKSAAHTTSVQTLERQRNTKTPNRPSFPHNLTAVKRAADTEAVESVNPGILNAVLIDQGLSVCLS